MKRSIAPKTEHRRARIFVLLALVAAGALCIDYVTKLIALSTLQVGDPVSVVGDLVSFTLVFNPGAAFSFAGGVTWVFSLIAVSVVIGIIWTARRLRSRGWAIGMGLLLGGTLGNLADRLLPKTGALQDRPFGQGVVVDFIQLKYFAVFNMADVFITTAVIIFVFLIVRGVTLEGVRSRDVPAKEPDDA